MSTLKVVPVSYEQSDLEAWKAGRYEAVLGKRSGWGPIERVLHDKARTRRSGFLQRGHKSGDARFFGEAVAAKHAQDRGWYGSYKWLTSTRWASQIKLPKGPKTEFRDALQHHFIKNLAPVRTMAMTLSRHLPRSKSGRPRKPVAPDLWLLTTNGSHRFIEAKLADRGDTVSDTQLAGLAVIATGLGALHTVSVEVFTLYCKGKRLPDDGRDEKERFEKFRKLLASAGPSRRR